jgi:hypothetical protein
LPVSSPFESYETPAEAVMIAPSEAVIIARRLSSKRRRYCRELGFTLGRYEHVKLLKHDKSDGTRDLVLMFHDKEASRVEYNHRNMKHWYFLALLTTTDVAFICAVASNFEFTGELSPEESNLSEPPINYIN